MDRVASFSGIASGIDFRALVDEIISVESAPLFLMEDKIEIIESRTSAWGEFRGLVDAFSQATLSLSTGDAFDNMGTSVLGPNPPVLTATSTPEATPASYDVLVNRLAVREKLGSGLFSSSTTALGIAGEFLVGSRLVAISSEMTLEDVRDAFNSVNIGTDASGVSASLLKISEDEYKLLVTADDTGAAGVNLVDSPDGVLRSLGVVRAGTTIKHATTDGAKGDEFTSASTEVATLLGFANTPATGSVIIDGFAVAIDLSTDSLDDIASAINTAAAAASSTVTATVATSTDSSGNTVYELEIDDTTSFSDSNKILEALGILEGSRAEGPVIIEASNAFTDGDASTVATTGTRISDIWVGGVDAGVKNNDTVTIDGTRGDGSSFSKTFTISATDTIQDLLDDLNSATDGFQFGARTATASLSANGQIVVTDDVTGTSQLALDITANNEGGGTLSFGSFVVIDDGMATEITAGQDSEIVVDGNTITRSSNTIDDVLTGVTLGLVGTSATTSTVTVTREMSGVAPVVQGLVDAFNAIQDFVNEQFSGAGGEDDVARPILSGDSNLRTMRDAMRRALESVLSVDVGGFSRLGDIGVEVDQDGKYTFDQAKLDAALAADPLSVSRLFSVYGTGSISTIEYVSSSDETKSGTYAVDITQLATRAQVLGTGFSGTYSDDATADTLTVQDTATGVSYSVSLADGMSLGAIVNALNSEFQTANAQQLDASDTMYSDSVGTVADDATLLQDLFDSGGTNVGVADGDKITISGFAADGSSVFTEFNVADITTQTLGDVRESIAASLGAGVDVTNVNGVLTVTNQQTGLSSVSLTVSSDNAGGGSLSFGTFDVVVEGRGTATITAAANGGQLEITHDEYGSAAEYDISFVAGGGDGTAQLGITAGTYAGLDVVGSINGVAGTGSGQLLTGADDTDMESLAILYSGSTLGSVGDVTFSRGVASFIELTTDRLLGSESGSIDGLLEVMDTSAERIQERIERLEDRLERRKEHLIKRFAALEQLLAEMDAQSQWLTAQLAALPRVGSLNG